MYAESSEFSNSSSGIIQGDTFTPPHLRAHQAPGFQNLSYLSSSPWQSYPPRGCKQFKISNTAAPAHAEQNTWPWDTWTHPPLISADQPGPHVRVHRGDSKTNCPAAPAPSLPPRFCSGCLRVEQPGWPLLFACWSCRDTYYCNGECQLRAWNEKGTCCGPARQYGWTGNPTIFT